MCFFVFFFYVPQDKRAIGGRERCSSYTTRFGLTHVCESSNSVWNERMEKSGSILAVNRVRFCGALLPRWLYTAAADVDVYVDQDDHDRDARAFSSASLLAPRRRSRNSYDRRYLVYIAPSDSHRYARISASHEKTTKKTLSPTPHHGRVFFRFSGGGARSIICDDSNNNNNNK